MATLTLTDEQVTDLIRQLPFEQRASGADREAFRAFLENGGGSEPPIEGDELPEGWVSRRRT